MQTEHVALAEGSARILAGKLNAWTVLAATAALVACGGGGSSPRPDSTLQSIALNPASVTLPTGGQQQLTVIGTYSDATTAPVTTGIGWSSSNPSVASMGGPGLVVATTAAFGAGTTTITASVGELSAQTAVTVTAPALLSISIEPPTAEMPVSLSLIQSFTAIGHYDDGSTSPLASVSWSSSNVAVATVDGSGYAQGVTVGGPVTITATDVTGKSGTASLTITAPQLQSIVVSPAVASVPATYSRQFTAIGRFSDGSNTPITASWSASSAAATVDANGVAAGVTAGPAPVTITASAGGLSANASLTVTVPVLTTDVQPHDNATVGAGAGAYRVTGLTPGAEYLVRVSTSDAIDKTDLEVEVDEDASFTARVCSSWAAGPPCRAGVASAAGELFVMVTYHPSPSEPLSTSFTLDTRRLPVLLPGEAAVASSVDTTETYYKVESLTAATFRPALGDGSGALDIFADLFAYDGPRGPGGAASLGSTVLATTVPKTFVANNPALAPAAYLTVEGWLTAAGTDFSVTVSQP